MAKAQVWQCPHCHQRAATRTVSTINGDGEIIRYRKCLKCGHNFKTVERLYSEDARALAASKLIAIGAPTDKMLKLLAEVPAELIIKYVDALPAFLHDRELRGDKIRHPGAFICWAIAHKEPIPTPRANANLCASPSQLAHKTETHSCADSGVDRDASAHKTEAQQLWCDAKRELELMMTDGAYGRWIKNSVAIERNNGTLMVAVCDRYAKEWCETRLNKMIERTLSGIAGEAITVRFVVQD